MVIDAKYKPHYHYGVDIEDVRQVSAYARMEASINKQAA